MAAALVYTACVDLHVGTIVSIRIHHEGDIMNILLPMPTPTHAP